MTEQETTQTEKCSGCESSQQLSLMLMLIMTWSQTLQIILYILQYTRCSNNTHTHTVELAAYSTYTFIMLNNSTLIYSQCWPLTMNQHSTVIGWISQFHWQSCIATAQTAVKNILSVTLSSSSSSSSSVLQTCLLTETKSFCSN